MIKLNINSIDMYNFSNENKKLKLTIFDSNHSFCSP